MLEYLLNYEDVAKEIKIPNLLKLREELERIEIKDNIIENILEYLYSRDMQIIKSAYLLGALDKERML